MKSPFAPRFLRNLVLLLLFFSAVVNQATVAGLSFGSRTWQVENGLPHNSVYSLLQTRDRYIWIGTHRGLVRFDGLNCTLFNLQSFPQLKEHIEFLYQTQDGILWIAPQKGEPVCYKNGVFIPSPLKISYPVKTILETKDKTLWIGTANGLIRYNNGVSQWFTKTNGLPDEIIISLCEDLDGNLWIGTNGGLIRYKDGIRDIYHDHYYLPANPVRTLYCDNENTLWIGTFGGGVARLQNGKFDYLKKERGLSDLFVTAITKDQKGNLWVGTLSGLARLSGDNFITQTNEDNPYEAIFCLMKDEEGNVWAGGKEGLSQLHPKPFTSYGKSAGLTHNNALSILEDHQSLIWVGTWGGGANVLSNGAFLNYSRTNSPVYDLILSLCEARDGSLWFGADFNGGLFRLRDGTITHYGSDEGFSDHAIRTIYEDTDGTLWLGTSTALCEMRNGLFRRYTTKDGLPSDTIRVIQEDHDAQLWIGTEGGLSFRNGERFSTFKTSNGSITNPVVALYEDQAHLLWIGTDGAGLLKLKNGNLTAYTSADGLFTDHILEILEDDQENLWLSSFSGVFRVRKKDLEDFDHHKATTLSCLSFGKSDGLSSVQCNGVSKPAGWKTRDGHLWFPTIRGIVSIDPKMVRDNDPPPPIVIETVFADKKILSPAAYSNIPPGRGELEFHYTALSFRAPEKNRFQFKLDGLDTDWVEAGERRAAYYSNIKPGSYTFRVRGCNADGVWNELGASLPILLLPHFWQTRWFLLLMVLAGAGLVASAVRYVTWKRLQGRLLRLEQQHAIERERTRIARDMHDDLGSRLTEILLVTDHIQQKNSQPEVVGAQAQRVANVAREVADNLDALVWTVNPANDSLDKFVIYLREAAGNFLEPTSIRLRFDTPTTVPEIPFSSEIRHNLLLVIKEAINNAIKYAECSEIKLGLKLNPGELQITIGDNGKGFLPETTAATGNGLINMEKRMHSIGGRWHLQSHPKQGTRIEINLPLSTER